MAEDNNLLKERLSILGKIGALTKEINKLNETDVKNKKQQTDLLAKANKLNSERIKKGNELKDINIKIADQQQRALAESQATAVGLSSISEKLKNSELERIDIQRGLNGLSEVAFERTNELASLAQEIASLSQEETIQRSELTSQFNTQLGLLEQQEGVSDELVNNFREQLSISTGISAASEREKELLQEQHAIIDGIRNTVIGFVEKTTTLYGNVQGALGGIVTLSGFLVTKMGEVNTELGSGLDLLNSTNVSAAALGFIFEDTVGTVKALSSEFGSTEVATFKTQANIGLMSMNMGISNEEAVALTGAFARLNNGSTEIATDMVKTTQQFAKQNNIIPSALMSDLAASTESFALFGEEGGENIIKAAGYAQKLGTNMDTVSSIAEGLLDFESSITKELELGALLGRDINLNKARQLAFEEDIEGATREVLNQLGGQAEFERMNYFQKKATADLMGVQVDELQRMVQNQETAGEQVGVIRESWNGAKESLAALTNEYLGVGLNTLGGWITASAQVAGNFSLISGMNLGGLFGKMGSGIKKVTGSIGEKLGGLIGKTSDTAAGASKGGLGMARFAGGLRMLASGLASFANPATLGGLAAVTASIIGLGFALKLAAPGIKSFGEAFSMIIESIATGISTVVSGIGDFIVKISQIASPEVVAGIFGLAAGFGALTSSLAAFSIVGLTALPTLITIGAMGELGGLFDDNEGEQKGNKMDELLGEMKGLRKDLNSGKVAVYMDGKKVTSAVANVVSNDSSNSYAI